MSERKHWVQWTDDMPEEELFVCPHCDAHMHVDSAGDECPNCGAPLADDATPQGER